MPFRHAAQQQMGSFCTCTTWGDVFSPIRLPHRIGRESLDGKLPRVLFPSPSSCSAAPRGSAAWNQQRSASNQVCYCQVLLRYSSLEDHRPTNRHLSRIVDRIRVTNLRSEFGIKQTDSLFHLHSFAA